MILEFWCGLIVVYTLYKIWRREKCHPKYTNKTVWITGASSGIGQALAYQFNLHDANLILSARNLQQLERVRQNCPNPAKVQIIGLDMTHFDEIEQVTNQVIMNLERSGKKIDVVVENAGISMRCDFRNYSFKNHLRMFDVNVNGQIRHIQCLLEHMIKNKGGQIVGITSAAGKIAKGYRSSYAGSKHAMVGILDSLRSEFYPYGIKVTNILPGYVHTNLSKNALGAAEGQVFGETDENNKKGMRADQFARIAVKAIYRKQNELQISKTWDVPIAMFLRNICPDLYFLAMCFNAKKQARASQKRR